MYIYIYFTQIRRVTKFINLATFYHPFVNTFSFRNSKNPTYITSFNKQIQSERKYSRGKRETYSNKYAKFIRDRVSIKRWDRRAFSEHRRFPENPAGYSFSSLHARVHACVCVHIYIFFFPSTTGAEIKWIRSGTINRHAQDLPSVLFSTTAGNKRGASRSFGTGTRTAVPPTRISLTKIFIARERVSYLFYSRIPASRTYARARARSTRSKSCLSPPPARVAFEKEQNKILKKQTNERRKRNETNSEKNHFIRDTFFLFFVFILNLASKRSCRATISRLYMDFSR